MISETTAIVLSIASAIGGGVVGWQIGNLVRSRQWGGKKTKAVCVRPYPEWKHKRDFAMLKSIQEHEQRSNPSY